MDNKAFDDSDLDEQTSTATQSSSRLASSHHPNSQLPSNTVSISMTANSSDKQSERVPINVSRPIFYTENFYPSLLTPSTSTGYSNPNSSAVPINHGSGHSSPDLLQHNINSSSSHQPSQSTKSLRSLLTKHTNLQSYRYCCTSCSPVALLHTLFPILTWLPKYNIKSDLLADIITGITILALHIPQGLAYGRLAGVDSINGLYVSLFPVVLYALFGGSRQISMGTFAVICIACKDVLDSLAAQGIVIYEDGHNVSSSSSSLSSLTIAPASPIEALTSLCLLVGLIQFALGFFRLGILATLLSDPIISSFVVACSLHVFTSQVFALFGVSSKASPDEMQVPFELVQNWIRLFSRIPSSNLSTMLISTVTITSLILCKNLLEPYLMKRFNLKNVTIPIDILMIIALTGVSYWFDLNGRFQVDTVPKITDGFKNMPIVPRFDLWPKLFSSAVLIAFIGYTATYTLSKIFARKHGYQVYPNQELIALGIANIVSSFLLCFPGSGSLARSAVQEKVGGRTQLASLISSGLIVIFILFFSHFLESLPNCVLACIIVVALRSMMLQFSEVFHYWRQSKMDGLLWAATFTLVVLFGVGNGLFYGLLVGLALLLIKIAMPQFNLKYHVHDTECYLGIDQAPDPAKLNTPGCIVFEFHGPFIFLNVERFKKCFDVSILRPIQKEHQRLIYFVPSENAKSKQPINQPSTLDKHASKTQSLLLINSVVFDMSRVSYLDSKAVECLLELTSELRQFNVELLLAGASEHVIDCLVACQFFEQFDTKQCYLTVHDAVTSVRLMMMTPQKS